MDGSLLTLHFAAFSLQNCKAKSPTAAFGAAMSGQRLIDQHTRRILDDILEEIRSGHFDQELLKPEAPILLQKYIDDLESSNLAQADKPFHDVNPDESDPEI